MSDKLSGLDKLIMEMMLQEKEVPKNWVHPDTRTAKEYQEWYKKFDWPPGLPLRSRKAIAIAFFKSVKDSRGEINDTTKKQFTNILARYIKKSGKITNPWLDQNVGKMQKIVKKFDLEGSDRWFEMGDRLFEKVKDIVYKGESYKHLPSIPDEYLDGIAPEKYAGSEIDKLVVGDNPLSDLNLKAVDRDALKATATISQPEGELTDKDIEALAQDPDQHATRDNFSVYKKLSALGKFVNPKQKPPAPPKKYKDGNYEGYPFKKERPKGYPQMRITNDWGRATEGTPKLVVDVFSAFFKTNTIVERIDELNWFIGRLGDNEAEMGLSLPDALSGVMLIDALSSIIGDFEASGGGFLFENFLAVLSAGTVESGNSNLVDIQIGERMEDELKPVSIKLLSPSSLIKASKGTLKRYFETEKNDKITYIVAMKARQAKDIVIWKKDITKNESRALLRGIKIQDFISGAEAIATFKDIDRATLLDNSNKLVKSTDEHVHEIYEILNALSNNLTRYFVKENKSAGMQSIKDAQALEVAVGEKVNMTSGNEMMQENKKKLLDKLIEEVILSTTMEEE